MEVVSFTLDQTEKQNGSPMLLLRVRLRTGESDVIVVAESQFQFVARAVLDHQRDGDIPTVEQLLREYKDQEDRAVEFHSVQETMRGQIISGPATELTARSVRTFFHGGGIFIVAATFSGRLFVALFDPMSAGAIPIAYDDLGEA